jgi:ribosomal protein S18 acetylase RimI-like enzyme
MTYVIKQLDVIIDNESSIQLVALDADNIFTITGVIKLDIPNNISTAAISSLYVKEKYRNNSIGTNLIEKCCDLAKSKEYATIVLQVLKDNIAAIHLYKKLGFILACEYEDGYLLFTKTLN